MTRPRNGTRAATMTARHTNAGGAVPLRTATRLGALLLALVLGMLSLSVLALGACGNEMKNIGVFQYGPDADTDAAYRGLLAGLAQKGYVEGENLTIDRRDCGGDQATIEKTARELAAAGLDAVVPLTTPCLVAAAQAGGDTPVVFTSVYDPMAAGVADSPGDHPPTLTGVYTPPPVEQTLDLVRECVPGVRAIGTAYNPREPNSSAAVERMRAYCEQAGLTLVVARVARTEEAARAVRELLTGGPGTAGSGSPGGAGAPQALYLTGDNTVMGAFHEVAATARKARIPLFINDPGFVGKGAVAGMGPDFANAGRAGGRLLARVLDGADPAGLPLRRDPATVLYVNRSAARTAGVSLTAAVLDRATEVF